MNESLIPSGKYCYHLVEIKKNEILSQEIEKFGMELREYSFNKNQKEVLCPYWQQTQYGTVRCNFLNREFIDELDDKALDKINAHFGLSHRNGRFESAWELSDEVKICGIHEDEEP